MSYLNGELLKAGFQGLMLIGLVVLLQSLYRDLAQRISGKDL